MRRILLRMRSTLPIRRALVLAATAWLATAAVRAADDTASRWWTHVEALANDGMEGRNTGSAGHKRAAEYVAAQFQKAALEPAGRRRRLHSAGEVQHAAHRRAEVEPRARQGRRGRNT